MKGVKHTIGLFVFLCLLLGRASGQFAPSSFYLIDSLPYKTLSDYDRSLLDSVLKVYHQEKNDTVKANLIIYLTENLEDQQAWIPYNKLIHQHAMFMLKNEGISVRQKKFYKRVLAGTYNNFGFAANISGRKEAALDYFKQSVVLLEELDNKEGLSDVYNNMGLIYKNIGQTSKSLDYYFKCLRITHELDDTKGQASSLNNIGMLYMDLEDYEKSNEYLQKALLQWQKLNNKRGISSTLSNLGLLYDRKGNSQQSVNYYTQALVWNEKTGDKEGIGTCLGNLGWIYMKQKQYMKAQNYFERSLMYRKLIDDKAGIGYATYNLGTLYKNMNQDREAKVKAREALEIAESLGYPDLIKRTSQLMYILEKEAGNHKEALRLHEQYIQMRDSILNEQTRKIGAKKQYQYEFDLKEAELKADQEKRNLLHQAEIKRQTLVFRVSLAGGVLFLLFSIVLFQRFRVIRKQKEIIEIQKAETAKAFHALHEKNKEVMDSIYYARRIQQTLLTSDAFFRNWLGENYFVMFRPKDIVSGDFYWATLTNGNKLYLAVCDSTGHGVPGAFMSLLNIGFLSEAINEKRIEQPADVLNYVREKLVSSLSKDEQKDGFDGTLVCYDISARHLTYSAANSRPLVVRDGELLELSYDRMPVGAGEKKESFRNHMLHLQTGDMLYLFTDGYADQFGGPKGKKFKLKQLQENLLAHAAMNPADQQKKHAEIFEHWKAWKDDNGTLQELEQLDDVCLFGIRIV